MDDSWLNDEFRQPNSLRRMFIPSRHTREHERHTASASPPCRARCYKSALHAMRPSHSLPFQLSIVWAVFAIALCMLALDPAAATKSEHTHQLASHLHGTATHLRHAAQAQTARAMQATAEEQSVDTSTDPQQVSAPEPAAPTFDHSEDVDTWYGGHEPSAMDADDGVHADASACPHLTSNALVATSIIAAWVAVQ